MLKAKRFVMLVAAISQAIILSAHAAGGDQSVTIGNETISGERVGKNLMLPQEREFTGIVVSVYDGDTLTVVDSKRHAHTIRLRGIDAPELLQEHGRVSKYALKDMVHKKKVTISYKEVDQYDRQLGSITYNGVDVNKKLVESGMAWVYRSFSLEEKGMQASASGKPYLSLESLAQEKRVGLWADGTASPPWEYRRAMRNRQSGSMDVSHEENIKSAIDSLKKNIRTL